MATCPYFDNLRLEICDVVVLSTT